MFFVFAKNGRPMVCKSLSLIALSCLVVFSCGRMCSLQKEAKEACLPGDNSGLVKAVVLKLGCTLKSPRGD